MLVLSAPASSEPVPSVAQVEDPTSIVVVGRASDRELVIESAKAVMAERGKMVPRFAGRVCPKVVGERGPHILLLDRASFEQRMRDVAADVGVPVAKPGCRPNLVAIFTNDPRKYMSDMERSTPGIIEATEMPQWRRLRRDAGPVWAWHAAEPRTAEGMDIVAKRNSDYQGERSNFARASRLKKNARWDTAAAYVVVDANAAGAIPEDALARFVAVAGLAPIDFGQVGDLKVPSILSLFHDSAAGRISSRELTSFDRALLRSLYRARPDASAAQIAARAVPTGE